MRGDQQVQARRLVDCVDQGVAITRRLRGKDIDGKASQLPFAQGGQSGFFIDHSTPGAVHQQGAFLDGLEVLGVEQMTTVFGQRAMQADHVGLGQQLGQCRAPVIGLVAWSRAETHPHAECLGQGGHLGAQFTLSHQHQMLAFELQGRVVHQTEERALSPAALGHVALVLGQASGQGEDQHQRMLGDTGSSVGVDVVDTDATLFRHLHVDIVGAGGQYADMPQGGQGVQGIGIQHHLVDDGDVGAGQPFTRLGRGAGGVNLEALELLAQRSKVNVGTQAVGVQ